MVNCGQVVLRAYSEQTLQNVPPSKRMFGNRLRLVCFLLPLSSYEEFLENVVVGSGESFVGVLSVAVDLLPVASFVGTFLFVCVNSKLASLLIVFKIKKIFKRN